MLKSEKSAIVANYKRDREFIRLKFTCGLKWKNRSTSGARNSNTSFWRTEKPAADSQSTNRSTFFKLWPAMSQLDDASQFSFKAYKNDH